jgi:hypothetical protein
MICSRAAAWHRSGNCEPKVGRGLQVSRLVDGPVRHSSRQALHQVGRRPQLPHAPAHGAGELELGPPLSSQDGQDA